MTLVRYNPLNDFIPSTFGDRLENALRKSNGDAIVPPVDILKDEKHFEVQLIVPGLKKEDFNINLEEDQLIITAERVKPEGNFIQNESRFGKFEKSFKLSKKIDKEAISAAYEAGILKVTIPLKEDAELKKVIKIK